MCCFQAADYQKGIARRLLVVVGLRRVQYLKSFCWLLDEKAEKSSGFAVCYERSHPRAVAGVGSRKTCISVRGCEAVFRLERILEKRVEGIAWDFLFSIPVVMGS